MSNKSLKILFVSAEVTPFAKTGGLADVSAALPKALSLMGHDVRIVMPKYRCTGNYKNYVTEFGVHVGNRRETIVVHEDQLTVLAGNEEKKVPVYMLGNYHYYDRDGIYCHEDDGERFALMCKASLELLQAIDFYPDIIHCNDWHTGPIPMILKEIYIGDERYKKIKTIFTIHNMEYQGHFSRSLLDFIGLSQEIFTPDLVEFYGVFNFMKAGLIYADKINTVSKTYANEISTPEFGERLEGVISARKKDVSGIINGIDTEIFDPETDPYLPCNYNAKSIEKKSINKWQLQKELGLKEGDFPLAGIVSRFATQKGLNLVLEVLPQLVKKGLQVVLLGVGAPFYEKGFSDLHNLYHDMIYVETSFNAPLAQKIYGSCDLFLMPSIFEPCGLGQLITMRYGGVPVVRATGGLADTVKDYSDENNQGNGFVFTDISGEAFKLATERAINLYKSNRNIFIMLQRNNMAKDYSWNKSSLEYERIYLDLIAENKL